jgi:hypothetical protein
VVGVKTAVCFAGCTMAKRLGADIKEWLAAGDFLDADERLLALDHLRLGHVEAAADTMPRPVLVDDAVGRLTNKWQIILRPFLDEPTLTPARARQFVAIMLHHAA